MGYDHQEIKDFINNGQNFFLPSLSIDCVVFGFQENRLKVLLLEMLDDRWVLPGGYIKKEEDIDMASVRILKERTGLKDIYLRQFNTFGSGDRNFAKEMQPLLEELGIPRQNDIWLAERFVSIGYYALVDINKTSPSAGMFSKSYGWFDVYDLPVMMMDHAEIALTALDKLRSNIAVEPTAVYLLPNKFTMPELHKTHQVILDKEMDRSRFQKKMLGLGIFERLQERKEGVPHKRPYLYMVKGAKS